MSTLLNSVRVQNLEAIAQRIKECREKTLNYRLFCKTPEPPLFRYTGYALKSIPIPLLPNDSMFIKPVSRYNKVAMSLLYKTAYSLWNFFIVNVHKVSFPT